MRRRSFRRSFTLRSFSIKDRSPRSIVFVITDGWFPKGPVDNLVKALEDRGIAVAMVGIGRHSTPKGSIIAKAEKIADLPRAVAKVLSGLAGKLRGIAA
ncbi:MAG: hypothetical protein ACLUNV_03855 [Sutterella wadsworthensis]